MAAGYNLNTAGEQRDHQTITQTRNKSALSGVIAQAMGGYAAKSLGIITGPLGVAAANIVGMQGVALTDREIVLSRSVLSIAQDELKIISQLRDVVHSPVEPISGGQFKRVVDTGGNIGITTLKEGGEKTSWIAIFTDSKGNLITKYPVKGN